MNIGDQRDGEVWRNCLHDLSNKQLSFFNSVFRYSKENSVVDRQEHFELGWQFSIEPPQHPFEDLCPGRLDDTAYHLPLRSVNFEGVFGVQGGQIASSSIEARYVTLLSSGLNRTVNPGSDQGITAPEIADKRDCIWDREL